MNFCHCDYRPQEGELCGCEPWDGDRQVIYVIFGNAPVPDYVYVEDADPGAPPATEDPPHEYYWNLSQHHGDARHLATRLVNTSQVCAKALGSGDGHGRLGGVHLQHGEDLQAAKTA